MGFVAGGFVVRDGAEGAEEVEVGLLFFAAFFGGFGDCEVEFALIFIIGLPLCDPAVEVLELRAEELERAAGAYDSEYGEEDVVSDVVILR